MYASTSTQLSRLAIGSTNDVLTVSGGVPAWTSTPTFGNTTLTATAKLFLDGGGDTYIHEESADKLDIVVGGTRFIAIDQDLNSIGIGPAHNASPRIAVQVGGTFTSDGSGTNAAYFNVGGGLTGASGDTEFLASTWLGGNITTQTASENIGVIAQLYLREPNITDTLTGDVTVAATLAIASIPTEGELNVAIYLADGDINMNGTSYLKLPIHDTNASIEGSLWYDASEDKLKFKTAVGVETITST